MAASTPARASAAAGIGATAVAAPPASAQQPPHHNHAEDAYENSAARLRFAAFSRLQAAAVAFGETLPIPEIVAVGGQSDGKSSLLEGAAS